MVTLVRKRTEYVLLCKRCFLLPGDKYHPPTPCDASKDIKADQSIT